MNPCPPPPWLAATGAMGRQRLRILSAQSRRDSRNVAFLLARLASMLPDFGSLGQLWPDDGTFWQDLYDMEPTWMARIRSNLAEISRVWPDSGQILPNWPLLGQFWPVIARRPPSLPQSDQNRAEHG